MMDSKGVKSSKDNKTPLHPTFRPGLFVALWLFWMILSGSADLRQFITGGICALLVTLVYEKILNSVQIKHRLYRSKVPWIPFMWLSLKIILYSAWCHIFRIISGKEDICFINISTEITDPLALSLISCAITLAPGTVAVEIEKGLLKILCFEPTSTKEREEIYHTVQKLEKIFLEVK